MSYAIVGLFARKNINVTVASRRSPEALAPEARAIGPTVVAKSLRDALQADTIMLAVPFGEHREIAKALLTVLPFQLGWIMSKPEVNFPIADHPRTCSIPDHKSEIRIRKGMISRAFVGRS